MGQTQYFTCFSWSDPCQVGGKQALYILHACDAWAQRGKSDADNAEKRSLVAGKLKTVTMNQIIVSASVESVHETICGSFPESFSASRPKLGAVCPAILSAPGCFLTASFKKWWSPNRRVLVGTSSWRTSSFSLLSCFFRPIVHPNYCHLLQF